MAVRIQLAEKSAQASALASATLAGSGAGERASSPARHREFTVPSPNRPLRACPGRFPHASEHEDPKHYSYPSGHSTRGTVFALLLAELFPGQREAILAKGREAGWLRVQGGVHYPSDIYAGRVLGQELARDFLHRPEFQADLAAAKAELAAGTR
jgi:membrane-associated phospholipid phosphatase